MKAEYTTPQAMITDFLALEHILAPHPGDDDRSRNAERNGGGILEGSTGFDYDRG